MVTKRIHKMLDKHGLT
jgi:hypothetical protein